MTGESLYDDAGPSRPNVQDEPMEGETDGSGSEQLINSELCPDCEVGDVLKVRVTRKMDKELAVEYMGKEEGEEKPEEGMEREGMEDGGEPGESLM